MNVRLNKKYKFVITVSYQVLFVTGSYNKERYTNVPTIRSYTDEN